MIHRHEDGTVAIIATVKYATGFVAPFLFSSGRAYTPVEQFLLIPDGYGPSTLRAKIRRCAYFYSSRLGRLK